jgi:hypothetical protein
MNCMPLTNGIVGNFLHVLLPTVEKATLEQLWVL